MEDVQRRDRLHTRPGTCCRAECLTLDRPRDRVCRHSHSVVLAPRALARLFIACSLFVHGSFAVPLGHTTRCRCRAGRGARAGPRGHHQAQGGWLGPAAEGRHAGRCQVRASSADAQQMHTYKCIHMHSSARGYVSCIRILTPLSSAQLVTSYPALAAASPAASIIQPLPHPSPFPPCTSPLHHTTLIRPHTSPHTSRPHTLIRPHTSPSYALTPQPRRSRQPNVARLPGTRVAREVPHPTPLHPQTPLSPSAAVAPWW
jgi:hypothetical protein